MRKYKRKLIISLSVLIFPWLTAPFIGTKSFVRFLPVATFANLFIIVFTVIANQKKWFRNNNPLFPKAPIDFTYILGPHLIGTLWIFKLTYGSFLKYILANTVLDWFNIFPFGGALKKVGIFKMKKMSPSMYWGMTTVLAVVLYGYQYIVEKVIRQTNDSQSRLQALKATIQKGSSNS
ncbi:MULTISPECIES: hypothetical protein [Priestia]|uniref:hypothetical protein n=1 Tax=Priestia TaxID=2800373 RepID=UPI000E1B3339|nr:MULTISPECIES: hypothetical protein [Priestia]MED3913360.1 hypothetical protein [Priestia megaterium]SUV10587.1 Uncharacterised protein [Priestia megaterium]